MILEMGKILFTYMSQLSLHSYLEASSIYRRFLSIYVFKEKMSDLWPIW